MAGNNFHNIQLFTSNPSITEIGFYVLNEIDSSDLWHDVVLTVYDVNVVNQLRDSSET